MEEYCINATVWKERKRLTNQCFIIEKRISLDADKIKHIVQNIYINVYEIEWWPFHKNDNSIGIEVEFHTTLQGHLRPSSPSLAKRCALLQRFYKNSRSWSLFHPPTHVMYTSQSHIGKHCRCANSTTPKIRFRKLFKPPSICVTIIVKFTIE